MNARGRAVEALDRVIASGVLLDDAEAIVSAIEAAGLLVVESPGELTEPDAGWLGDPTWHGRGYLVARNGPWHVTVVVGKKQARRSIGLANNEARVMAHQLLAAIREPRDGEETP